MAALRELLIDPATGMAGDLLCGALVSLGAPLEPVVRAMERAALPLGRVTITHRKTGTKVRLKVHLEPNQKELPEHLAHRLLDESLAGLEPPYSAFARRALDILCAAERAVHGEAHGAETGVKERPEQYPVTAIGIARTPFQEEAPYQARTQGEAGRPCAIDLYPQYAPGLADLDRFSHVFVFSYLDRSRGYGLEVTPPWQETGSASRGLFATRSPNRPSPIGISRVPILGVEGPRLYVGQLDLFDGTPVIDLKPYVESLDGSPGNDGWLEGTEHLELHRLGVPHRHDEVTLHEAQGILIDLVGAAVALQYLHVDLARVTCLSPVRVGGGTVTFSHGTLNVPAPATQAILRAHHVPVAPGPIDRELLTPTGAALLAALSPAFVPRADWDCRAGQLGLGRGAEMPGLVNELCVALL